jgi:hypothetical protein
MYCAAGLLRRARSLARPLLQEDGQTGAMSSLVSFVFVPIREGLGVGDNPSGDARGQVDENSTMEASGETSPESPLRQPKTSEAAKPLSSSFSLRRNRPRLDINSMPISNKKNLRLSPYAVDNSIGRHLSCEGVGRSLSRSPLSSSLTADLPTSVENERCAALVRNPAVDAAFEERPAYGLEAPLLRSSLCRPSFISIDL